MLQIRYNLKCRYTKGTAYTYSVYEITLSEFINTPRTFHYKLKGHRGIRSHKNDQEVRTGFELIYGKWEEEEEEKEKAYRKHKKKSWKMRKVTEFKTYDRACKSASRFGNEMRVHRVYGMSENICMTTAVPPVLIINCNSYRCVHQMTAHIQN
jgi:hypothetical protein